MGKKFTVLKMKIRKELSSECFTTATQIPENIYKRSKSEKIGKRIVFYVIWNGKNTINSRN